MKEREREREREERRELVRSIRTVPIERERERDGERGRKGDNLKFSRVRFGLQAVAQPVVPVASRALEEASPRCKHSGWGSSELFRWREVWRAFISEKTPNRSESDEIWIIG